MELLVFGVNHTTAPVQVRERWALSRDDSLRQLAEYRERVEHSEHLILSTCNRTEFYSRLPGEQSPIAGTEGAAQQRSALLEFYYGHRPTAEEIEHFYVYRERAAVEHLFRLAGGLNSMIVGESEILGQIKDAYQVSQEAQAAGHVFHRLFPAALSTGKRVRAETQISEGCITPGQAALRLARQTLGQLEGLRVLLIGSGKIATLTARALASALAPPCPVSPDPNAGFAAGTVEIVNRTGARAKALARSLEEGFTEATRDGKARRPQVEVTPWSALDEALERADFIITSTGSPAPILDAERLRGPLERREAAHGEDRPWMAVDLAIPRDIHPEVGTLRGVRLYNLDDLNQVIHDNIEERHRHIPAAEDIVREQIHSFVGRIAYQVQVEPVIRHMFERFEEIRLGTLQSSIDGFAPEDHEKVDRLTRRLVAKLIDFPISRLKALRDLGGLSDEEVRFLKKMFPTDPS